MDLGGRDETDGMDRRDWGDKMIKQTSQASVSRRQEAAACTVSRSSSKRENLEAVPRGTTELGL